MMMPADLSLMDYVALFWLAASWLFITYLGRYSSTVDHRSLSFMSKHYRRAWMENMMVRENRITDATLLGRLMQSVSFFTSTTILVIAGLITLMGVTDKLIATFEDIAFAQHSSPAVWKIKIMLLTLIFVYAFFKFVWSLRQFNTASIIMGAAPQYDPEKREMGDAVYLENEQRYSVLLTTVINRAGYHFNEGMRSFEYALAVLAWFIHPVAFICATLLVSAIIYRREFVSRTLRALEAGSD